VRGEELEVLAFLSTRPLHTVFLRGFIRDNGLEDSRNRGLFYGCRDRAGNLQGVALIGHATLFEANNERVIRLFAHEAQTRPNIHMIIGEQRPVELFWKSYFSGGQRSRLICHELLMELRQPILTHEIESVLRPATLNDLSDVMQIQAQMAFAESGINPLEVDFAGFRKRCARRIELSRIWICVENKTPVFKVDIMLDTPEVIYLEGIYVHPSHRGNGYGLSCLSQVSKNLLRNTRSLCLFVNEQYHEARNFYNRAGFTQRSRYFTIFLEPRSSGATSNA
jgi:uncharacterized protein